MKAVFVLKAFEDSIARHDDKVRPVAKSISIPTSEFNVPATLDDTMSPNRIAATATSPSLQVITDIYLTIYKEENRTDPVRLNISFIFTDVYDESQQYIPSNVIPNSLQFILRKNLHS